MKLYFIYCKLSDEMAALREVFPDLGIEQDVNGDYVYLRRREKGLRVFREGKDYVIEFSTRASLIRGAGILAENYGKKTFDVEETPRFDVVGTMPDCSRNAVIKRPALKELIRRSALMGLNAMMLYIEDTYEIENRPHFGYMRGRYNKGEFKELDKYARLMGIELVPAIQTLAHLATIFQWKEFLPLRDNGDILLADDERVYSLIDDMLDTVFSCFTTRRVNLGMDEAWLVGSGQYMRDHGYVPRTEIMKRHLAKVMEKCRARGLEPEIWSDMFFRMQSKTGAYYDLDIKKMSKEVIEAVPEDVTLVYWDYYSVNKAKYDAMFARHAEFGCKTGFAGGAACWYGNTPLNTFSVKAAKTALTSALENGMKQVWITMWGDDGAACSPFATLSTMTVYSEFCWSGDLSDKYLEKRMKTTCGASYKDFLSLESPNFVPKRTIAPGEGISNPAKYMFYQDPLSGKYDRHIPEGTAKHFADTAKKLTAAALRNPGYAYIFETLSNLCRALEIKSELGVRLKEAYDASDRATLKKYSTKLIPELIKRIEAYYESLRAQWRHDNKMPGFEVMDVRIGGLIFRLKDVKYILDEYLSGKTDRIPELDVVRIPFDPSIDGLPVPHIHRYAEIVTSNVRP